MATNQTQQCVSCLAANNCDPAETSGQPSVVSLLLPPLGVVFLAIYLGAVLGRYKIVDPTVKKGLSPVLGKVLLPMLLFRGTSKINFDSTLWSFFWCNLLAKSAVIIAAFTAVILFSHTKKRENLKKAGMAALFTTRSAIWSIGLPIVNSIFPEYADLVYVCALVDNMLIMPLGLCTMELGFIPEDEPPSLAVLHLAILKTCKQPVVILSFLALVLNFTVGHEFFASKNFVTDFVDLFASGYPCVALFSLGLGLSKGLPKASGASLRLPVTLIFAKTLVLPILTNIFVYQWTKNANLAYFGFIYNAMPTSPAVAAFSTQYKVMQSTVTMAILYGTIFAGPLLLVTGMLAGIQNSSLDDTVRSTVVIYIVRALAWSSVAAIGVTLSFQALQALRFYRRVKRGEGRDISVGGMLAAAPELAKLISSPGVWLLPVCLAQIALSASFLSKTAEDQGFGESAGCSYAQYLSLVVSQYAAKIFLGGLAFHIAYVRRHKRVEGGVDPRSFVFWKLPLLLCLGLWAWVIAINAGPSGQAHSSGCIIEGNLELRTLEIVVQVLITLPALAALLIEASAHRGLGDLFRRQNFVGRRLKRVKGLSRSSLRKQISSKSVGQEVGAGTGGVELSAAPRGNPLTSNPGAPAADGAEEAEAAALGISVEKVQKANAVPFDQTVTSDDKQYKFKKVRAPDGSGNKTAEDDAETILIFQDAHSYNGLPGSDKQKYMTLIAYSLCSEVASVQNSVSRTRNPASLELADLSIVLQVGRGVVLFLLFGPSIGAMAKFFVNATKGLCLSVSHGHFAERFRSIANTDGTYEE